MNSFEKLNEIHDKINQLEDGSLEKALARRDNICIDFHHMSCPCNVSASCEVLERIEK